MFSLYDVSVRLLSWSVRILLVLFGSIGLLYCLLSICIKPDINSHSTNDLIWIFGLTALSALMLGFGTFHMVIAQICRKTLNDFESSDGDAEGRILVQMLNDVTIESFSSHVDVIASNYTYRFFYENKRISVFPTPRINPADSKIVRYKFVDKPKL